MCTFLLNGGHKKTGYRSSFLGVQQQGNNVNHIHPLSAEFKNEWSYTSKPPLCLHGVNRDNFTLEKNFLYSFANYITYSTFEGFPPSLTFIITLWYSPVIQQEVLWHSVYATNSNALSPRNSPPMTWIGHSTKKNEAWWCHCPWVSACTAFVILSRAKSCIAKHSFCGTPCTLCHVCWDASGRSSEGPKHVEVMRGINQTQCGVLGLDVLNVIALILILKIIWQYDQISWLLIKLH